ncbi:sigma-w pathway protein ysdB [Planomicrobium sp. YIM 101495]|uniref:sigma-w pathway protein ysdB n=1 Tax=Planomicrobium sp. YIM 101495 TaxID=2665160 RepID=UPI0012B6EF2A|nr:sigma-w pathway protein ysdB [Planomicrobium sp. YIM 101495]MTD29608.1 sigma-w pathway protein ysdB [Planomicrobium sp. YIM 101495]
MAFIIRLLVIALVIYLFYRLIRFIFDPKRKLDAAIEASSYYFYDDVSNVRKNFFITLRGVLFEGEKYLGTTEESFEVVSIFVWVENPDQLQGFSREDFLFLEKEIHMNYPDAQIDWQNPIEKLMKKES